MTDTILSFTIDMVTNIVKSFDSILALTLSFEFRFSCSSCLLVSTNNYVWFDTFFVNTNSTPHLEAITMVHEPLSSRDVCSNVGEYSAYQCLNIRKVNKVVTTIASLLQRSCIVLFFAHWPSHYRCSVGLGRCQCRHPCWDFSQRLHKFYSSALHLNRYALVQ